MSNGFIPNYNFKFIPKATQTNVYFRLGAANPPKFINIYKDMCECNQDDIKNDRTPWVSALLATVIEFCEIHLASVLAKKNVQMQVKYSYTVDGFMISMLIPNQMSLVMKIFSNIKKLLSVKVINNAIGRLKKMNKQYLKDNNIDTIKQYMMGLLVGIHIGCLSKETSKTGKTEYLDKLKKQANSKLSITTLDQKAQFKQQSSLQKIHQVGYTKSSENIENIMLFKLLQSILQDMNIEYYASANMLYIRTNQLTKDVKMQIKSFLKTKLSFLLPANYDKYKEKVLQNKKDDLIQFIFSLHAVAAIPDKMIYDSIEYFRLKKNQETYHAIIENTMNETL